MVATPVILDVDTGVDDALAILLALRTPACSLVGITTVHGNASLERTTANTLHVLDVADAPAVPVVAGAGAPLSGAGRRAADVHGEDGLGGIAATLPASSRRATADGVEFLVDMARRFPGALTVVAVGPLTNIALAVRRDPAALRGIKSLVVMGGAVRVPGNRGPVSEFNFFADPDAAAEVITAGLPLTLVPLDATEQVVLTAAALTHAGGKLAGFIRRLTATTIAFHRAKERIDGMFLHDPLALAVALDPSLVRIEPMRLSVETRGALTAGMAVPDFRRRAQAPPNVDVAVGVDGGRFLRDVFSRVLD